MSFDTSTRYNSQRFIVILLLRPVYTQLWKFYRWTEGLQCVTRTCTRCALWTHSHLLWRDDFTVRTVTKTHVQSKTTCVYRRSNHKVKGLWAPPPQSNDIHTTHHTTTVISDPTTFTGTNQKTTHTDPRAIEFTAMTNLDSFTFLYTPYFDKQTLTHTRRTMRKYRKHT